MTPFSHIKDYNARRAAMALRYEYWISLPVEQLLGCIQSTFREASIRRFVE